MRQLVDRTYLIAFLLPLTLSVSCAVAEAAAGLRLNQVGHDPQSSKMVVVVGADADQIEVREATGELTAIVPLGPPQWYAPSGERVRVADLSELRSTGRYQITSGSLPATDLVVAENPYSQINRAALKAFYLIRAGYPMLSDYAGIYARQGGHPDSEVVIHPSAAGPTRNSGDVIAAPGGWYDAGDYNKYVVNSGITTYTLLAAFEHQREYYQEQNVGIPESGNHLPDILDEAAFNLRWMLSMQDPADGGVYHKLTTARFSGMVMPSAATETRYVVTKSTAAALNLAAVSAVCARVFSEFDKAAPALADRCREAAISAWRWAKAHPETLYRQPDDIQTGTYARESEDLRDEFAWAAAELFLMTGDKDYLDTLAANQQGGGVPSWDWVEPLAWLSLAHHLDRAPDFAAAAHRAILTTADALVREYQTSAYRVTANAFPEDAMIGQQEQSFVWGSNGHVANQAMVLINAYRLTGEISYRNAAQAALDYLLGRNPIGISFVSGFGSRTPMNLHHRISVADGIEQPIPGMLAGGPNQHRQDVENCARENVSYPSRLPALSYIDEVCSYASNEMAINWNAPLVYITGALDVRP